MCCCTYGSANVYDSLGDAYRKIGNKELAIKNYRESIRDRSGEEKRGESLSADFKIDVGDLVIQNIYTLESYNELRS